MSSPADERPLRVLHVNDAATWRGGERQVLNLALALQEAGIAQRLVVRENSELAERAGAAGLPIETIPLGGLRTLLAGRRIRRIVDDFGATLLHTHTSGAHSLALAALRSRPGVRLVVSRRVDFPVARDFVSRRKYLSPRVSAYIAVSRSVAEVLTASGIDGRLVRVVHSAIDPKRYDHVEEPDYLRAEFSVKPDEVVLGNVAALVDHKDQRTLLEAAARLPVPGTVTQRGTVPPWKLLILGEGKLRPALEKQSRQLGLEQSGRVVFTGFRTDVLSFYRLLDVFVMSSKEEGLGTAVLDALYFGLPVATTAGGGLPELVDDRKGGFVVPIGDAAALADRMLELMLSSRLRTQFGMHNEQRAEDFTMPAVREGTLRVYREVLT